MDYARYAEGLGLLGVRVDDPGDVADDLTAAQAANPPSPSEDSHHVADHSAQPA